MFGWFKRHDVHLSPEIQGVITHKGSPIAGVRVYRELDYDRAYTDSTLTNDQGQFHFAAKNIRSSLPGNMLDQSTVRQVLSLDHNNTTYVLWYASTPSLIPNAAFDKALSALRCELTHPERHYVLANEEQPEFPLGVIGICQLDAPLIGTHKKTGLLAG